MTMPKAYAPEDGYKYQILCRNRDYGNEWEHCDYAVNRKDRDYLMGEYSLAYQGFELKAILLPRRCWQRMGA
jgi:hypothetical protein